MNTPNTISANETSLRVVFVEDYEFDVELAVLELERDGFDVTWFRVEVESDLRNILVSEKLDIVLSDYSMPHFDGLSALRIVQEISPDLPFIFISGTIGEERAIESIRNGATDYVLKGNIRRLATAVRRALSDKNERIQIRLAEEERSRLAAILEATSDFVTICNPDGSLIFINSAGSALTGISEITGAEIKMRKLYPQWAWDLIENEGLPAAMKNDHWQGETTMLALDGTEVPVSQVILSHRADDNSLSYISTIARDIRERKIYEERIAHLANYDALTDLPNRSLLNDRLTQATTFGRRTERSLALLVVDIDRFKLVNDGFGQGIGDSLLQSVGGRLIESIREGDTVARLGADTFAVLATDLARPDDILLIVRKIQDLLRAPFFIDGYEIHITVSIGASIYPRDGENFDILLRNSDAAMHKAKAQGQNSFSFFAEEMTRNATDRVELENALRLAVTRNEMELYYQPQVSLLNRKLIGMEALMRWKHPERGMISPGLFIPVAENSELIFELGYWALVTACKQLRDWGKKAETLTMAVNVSARQFLSNGFADIVRRVLRESSLEPCRLELELTESVLVEDKERAGIILNQLKSLGVKIAIDDFGTGYSSLSYLSRLPIDCLKIDQSFIQSFMSDKNNAVIVQTIISLGNSLRLRVLAEGIETGDQLTFLQQQGCMEGQGYLFSRPLPASSIATVLSAGLQNEPV